MLSWLFCTSLRPFGHRGHFSWLVYEGAFSVAVRYRPDAGRTQRRPDQSTVIEQRKSLDRVKEELE
uniref:Uncharacterized protein n=1 Tax=Peronospora matthiolae TaxID=2874970 RepID=A0AAV1TP73_9STRA